MSLPHAILTILEREKSSGYDLARHFALTTGQVWPATHQQIYLELSKLHQAGMVNFEQVSQNGKPDKKIYSVTEAGLSELARWLMKPTAHKRVREALLIKVLGSHLVSPDSLVDDIRDQREQQQTLLDEHRAALQELGRKDALSAQQRALWLTLRRSILEREAWLEWANEAEALFDTNA